MELKQLIKQQKAKGVLVKTLAHPSLVIMAQDCGMDFILYDCEHGVLSYEQLHDLMVLGNMRKLSSIVRVCLLYTSERGIKIVKIMYDGIYTCNLLISSFSLRRGNRN